MIVFLVVYTGLFLFFGRMGDVWGFRPVFLVGIAVFAAGCLFCGIAGTINEMMGARICQAAGASMIIAIGPAFVARSFPPLWIGKGLGLITAAVVLGMDLGPPLGIFIETYFSWRWAFLVNVPLCLALLVVAYAAFPRDTPAMVTRSADTFGGILFAVSLLFIFALIGAIEDYGFASLLTVSMILFAMATVTILYILERRAKEPLLDARVFTDRTFLVAGGSLVFVKMAANGPMFLLPFYLSGVLGYPLPMVAYLLLVPGSVMALSSLLSGELTDRFDVRLLCIAAALAGFFTYMVLVLAGPGIPFFVLIITLGATGLAHALFIVPNSRIMLDNSPPDLKGSASGVIKTLGNTGSTLGIAMSGIIFMALYQQAANPLSEIDFTTLPAGELSQLFCVLFFAAAVLWVIASALMVLVRKSGR